MLILHLRAAVHHKVVHRYPSGNIYHQGDKEQYNVHFVELHIEVLHGLLKTTKQAWLRMRPLYLFTWKHRFTVLYTRWRIRFVSLHVVPGTEPLPRQHLLPVNDHGAIGSDAALSKESNGQCCLEYEEEPK